MVSAVYVYDQDDKYCAQAEANGKLLPSMCYRSEALCVEKANQTANMYKVKIINKNPGENNASSN